MSVYTKSGLPGISEELDDDRGLCHLHRTRNENYNAKSINFREFTRRITPPTCGRKTPNLLDIVHGMATNNGSDIVLPIIHQHKGKLVTAGVVRKKSTPKIISTRRHFELYGQGDVRTQGLLKTLQQTLGREHCETYDRLLRALKIYSNDRDLDRLFSKLLNVLKEAEHEFIFHALRGFLPNSERPRFDTLLAGRGNFNQEVSLHLNVLTDNRDVRSAKSKQPLVAHESILLKRPSTADRAKEREQRINYPPESPYHKSKQTPRSIPRILPKQDPVEPVDFDRISFEKNYFGDSDFEDDDMTKGNIRKITVQKEANEGFGFVIKGEQPVFIYDIKPESAAARAGLQVGDRIISVNEISIKNFNREKIVSILVGCGKNPNIMIQDGIRNQSANGRLSRADSGRFVKICERYGHHASVDGLFEELQEEFARAKPDRSQLASILESNLPLDIAVQMKERLLDNSRCDSAQFVKEFRRNQRERSATPTRVGSVGSAGSYSRSTSGNSATTDRHVELSQSMRKQIQRKIISSAETEDGVNYKQPKARHVSAKRTDSTGRRKCWKNADTSPFPAPTSPSVHSEDSLEGFSDTTMGFQQRMTKFHEPEPEPEPLYPPSVKPMPNGKIKNAIKTKILPLLHPQKAQNYSILIAHLQLSPAEIVRSLVSAEVGKLENCHLKTLIKNKPDERETAALIDRHQNRQAMNEADQLAVAMINTSDYILRLKCLIYKSEFDGRDVQVKPAFECVTKASNQLKKAKTFGRICDFILADEKITTKKADLKFKATMLAKFNANQNGSTAKAMLETLIVTFESKFPALLEFQSELVDVKAAAKVNYSALRYEMQRFRNECNFLLTQVESMRRQNSKDKFPKIIKDYLMDADKKLCDIEIVMAQAQRQFFQCAKHFSENPTVIKTEDFFQLFSHFMTNFTEQVNELTGTEL